MMRVLIPHSGNMYGGLERALDTFAQASKYVSGLSPSFALCFDGPSATSLRAVGAVPVILGDVRLTRFDQVLRARRRFARLLTDVKPAVVITPSPWTHAIFAPVVRRARIPLVLWLHDALSGSPLLERLAGRHQPDLLIGDSHFCVRAARSVFPNVPARVVYYAVTFSEPGRSRAEVRQSLGVHDHETVIVNVARMEPWKGQAVLLDALATLRERHAWSCWFVGGAQRPEEVRFRDMLIARARSLGLQDRVRLLGHRSDIPDILNAADVYCHPNQGAEPFGLAIVEALYAGLPVVASDLGGPHEILEDGCGWLVPAGDVAALGSVLGKCIEDRTIPAEMSQGSRARAVQLCDPRARFAEFADALESVCRSVAA